MQVDVYDSYAKTIDGQVLHFDVLIPAGQKGRRAYEYALVWLASIEEGAATLRQEECRFCHQENASGAAVEDIESQGFHIIQMDGCPNPI